MTEWTVFPEHYGDFLIAIYEEWVRSDVGQDTGAPVSPDFGPLDNGFTGEIRGVQLTMNDDPGNSSHTVLPEDAIRAMLGRQEVGRQDVKVHRRIDL